MAPEVTQPLISRVQGTAAQAYATPTSTRSEDDRTNSQQNMPASSPSTSGEHNSGGSDYDRATSLPTTRVENTADKDEGPPMSSSESSDDNDRPVPPPSPLMRHEVSFDSSPPPVRERRRRRRTQLSLSERLQREARESQSESQSESEYIEDIAETQSERQESDWIEDIAAPQPSENQSESRQVDRIEDVAYQRWEERAVRMARTGVDPDRERVTTRAARPSSTTDRNARIGATSQDDPPEDMSDDPRIQGYAERFDKTDWGLGHLSHERRQRK